MKEFNYIAKSGTVYKNQFYFYTLSTKHYKLKLQILNLYCNKNTRYLEINPMKECKTTIHKIIKLC